MSYPPGSRVPPGTTWRDLTPGTVALYTDDAILVVEARDTPSKAIRVTGVTSKGESLSQVVLARELATEVFPDHLTGEVRAVTLPPMVHSPRDDPADDVAMVTLPLMAYAPGRNPARLAV